MHVPILSIPWKRGMTDSSKIRHVPSKNHVELISGPQIRIRLPFQNQKTICIANVILSPVIQVHF